ncbi:MAG: hypothetical protein RBG13Loki_1976 [Promethearchaeota archaeon CR_4]|nr:MAG: hypothetical protein RBG13Loki_1976 [Candidatus Lokiarchaeota archaeon CR_4]
MVFVYEELQLFLVIPKVLEGIISLITAIIVFRKSKYIVNRAFFLAFLAWSIGAFLDGTMYLIAANSEFDLFVANILRDFAMALSNVTCFALFFAVLVITRGKSEVVSTKMIALIISLFLVIVVVTDIGDYLAVVNTTTGAVIPAVDLPPGSTIAFRVTAPANIISATGFIASLTIFIISVGILGNLLRKIRDPSERRRIGLFLIGLVLLVVGYAWFFIIVTIKFQNLATYWIGYLVWTAAPIFTLKGVSPPETNSEKDEKKSIEE